MMENGVAETLKSRLKHNGKDTGELEAQKHSAPDTFYSSIFGRAVRELGIADERRIEVSVVGIGLED